MFSLISGRQILLWVGKTNQPMEWDSTINYPNITHLIIHFEIKLNEHSWNMMDNVDEGLLKHIWSVLVRQTR